MLFMTYRILKAKNEIERQLLESFLYSASPPSLEIYHGVENDDSEALPVLLAQKAFQRRGYFLHEDSSIVPLENFLESSIPFPNNVTLHIKHDYRYTHIEHRFSISARGVGFFLQKEPYLIVENPYTLADNINVDAITEDENAFRFIVMKPKVGISAALTLKAWAIMCLLMRPNSRIIFFPCVDRMPFKGIIPDKVLDYKGTSQACDEIIDYYSKITAEALVEEIEATKIELNLFLRANGLPAVKGKPEFYKENKFKMSDAIFSFAPLTDCDQL